MWVNSTGSIDKKPQPKSKTLNSSPAIHEQSLLWMALGKGWINLRKPLAHWAKKDPEMKVWTAKFVPTKYYYSIPKSFKFSHLRPSKTKRHRIYFATWYASENLEALQIIWVISPGRDEKKYLKPRPTFNTSIPLGHDAPPMEDRFSPPPGRRFQRMLCRRKTCGFFAIFPWDIGNISGRYDTQYLALKILKST